MTDRDAMEAANGHIEIDSYTVTYGKTRVKIQREGAMWRVVSLGKDGWGPRFPDGNHEAMMGTAVEYAKRVDLARQAIRTAEDAQMTTDTGDYDEIDQLIKTDPIALGERCRRAEVLLERVFAAETWDEIKAIQRRAGDAP